MSSTNEVRYLIDARRAAVTGEGRQLRIAARLTQAETGAQIGVSGPAVARWESGDRTPRGEAAIRYGKLLAALRRDIKSAVPA